MRSSIEKLFSDIDQLNAALFVQHLDPDVVMQFGSAPTLHGREAVQRAIAGFFEQIGGIRHEIHTVCEGAGVTAVQMTTHYTRLDGTRVAVPCAVFLKSEPDSLIQDYRIYIDLSPLFQPQ